MIFEWYSPYLYKYPDLSQAEALKFFYYEDFIAEYDN